MENFFRDTSHKSSYLTTLAATDHQYELH